MREIQAHWYVAQTQRHRERVAGSMLRRHFETYLPLIHEDPPPVVGAAIAPMFPCYIFVRAPMPDAYQRIMRTPGVKDLLRIAGMPGTVSDEVIGFLRAKEGPDGIVCSVNQLEPGASVEIVRGSFRGIEAVVENCVSSRERVHILMTLFQRQARVEIPSGWLKER